MVHPGGLGVWKDFSRYLQSQGRLIGANDLWIAASARACEYPLVTANTEDFQRVPDWHSYPPKPKANSLAAALRIINEDANPFFRSCDGSRSQGSKGVPDRQ